LKLLSIEDLNKNRYQIKSETIKICNNTIWFACDDAYKTIWNEVPYEQEIQIMIDRLINLKTKSCKV